MEFLSFHGILRNSVHSDVEFYTRVVGADMPSAIVPIRGVVPTIELMRIPANSTDAAAAAAATAACTKCGWRCKTLVDENVQDGATSPHRRCQSDSADQTATESSASACK